MSTAYAFTNTPSVDQQLAALTEALDPHTRGSLHDAGLHPGMTILDVGAGSGTIAGWLADTVGPTGHVTATDLDISRLKARPNLTVDRHDITVDPLPEGAFDVIHARLVLIHLPERPRVVARLASALRPGGILVLHEFDCTWYRPVHTAPTPADEELFHQVHSAINEVLLTAGARLDWGLAAHAQLVGSGLEQVSTHVFAETFQGGSAWARLAEINTIQLQSKLQDRGLTSNQLDRYRVLMAMPEFVATSYLVTRTAGRRPR